MTLVAEFHAQISEIGKTAWDACAAQKSPFTSYAFLSSLEDAGCVNAETGWLPQHVSIREQGGPVLAVAPLYLKSHSYGEYVFDHAWADAFERAGGTYYPKLLSFTPFTPANGPRLLVPPKGDKGLRMALLSSMLERTRTLGLSSCHLTFLMPDDADVATEAGFLMRHDQQFHWRNKGYESFADFLAALSSRKRKQIKRERRTVHESDITIRTIRGADITEAHWDAFFRFYMDTASRKWGSPYLNRTAFSLIGERMPDNILLFLCERGGTPIAGALNFIGPDTLYGRYWGCVEDHPCLHFEACYYRAIDYAIDHNISTVEAGAQGPHKVARGYEPIRTTSAHYIRDAGFHTAVEDYLSREDRMTEQEIAYMERHLPFKKQP